MKMEQSVPKRLDLKFRRRGITQKKEHNTSKQGESLTLRKKLYFLTS